MNIGAKVIVTTACRNKAGQVIAKVGETGILTRGTVYPDGTIAVKFDSKKYVYRIIPILNLRLL